jgi:cardiolipin synthase (CMP-forming)
MMREKIVVTSTHSRVPPVNDEPGSDRILTIPNVITMARLSLLPVFVWLLFAKDDRSSAAYLLAVIGTTDFFDGYIARHFHQVSELGKILDPVADRLLFFVGGGCILIDGSIPTWFAVAVLTREVLISAATLGLAAAGARRIDVTWFGKAGAFALMMSIPFFLGSHASDLGWQEQAEDLAWVTGLPGLALYWYSLLLYVPMGLRALREGRADRAAEAMSA